MDKNRWPSFWRLQCISVTHTHTHAANLSSHPLHQCRLQYFQTGGQLNTVRLQSVCAAHLPSRAAVILDDVGDNPHKLEPVTNGEVKLTIIVTILHLRRLWFYTGISKAYISEIHMSQECCHLLFQRSSDNQILKRELGHLEHQTANFFLWYLHEQQLHVWCNLSEMFGIYSPAKMGKKAISMNWQPFCKRSLFTFGTN